MHKIQPVVLSAIGRGTPDLLLSQLRDRIAPPILHRDDGRGAAIGTRDAIARAADSGEHVLFLEDDVVTSPHLLDVVPRTEFPNNVGVISFCDMREIPPGAPNGLYTRNALGTDGRGWWGNQALLIHKEVARYLATSNWFDGWVNSSNGVRSHVAAYNDGWNCSDIRMSLLVCLGPRPRYAVHVPSLFLHVGLTSACFPNRTGIMGMGERWTRNVHPGLKEEEQKLLGLLA